MASKGAPSMGATTAIRPLSELTAPMVWPWLLLSAAEEIMLCTDAGCAVLVVSEELEELFEISDRLHVIAKGRLSPSLPRAEDTVERIGEWMSGLWPGAEKEADHAAA